MLTANTNDTAARESDEYPDWVIRTDITELQEAFRRIYERFCAENGVEPYPTYDAPSDEMPF
jgi:hypothetical protein